NFAFDGNSGVVKPPPSFPQEEIAGDGEGWALFNFTVDTDGVPKDIVLIDQMGSDAFGSSGLATLRQWRYRQPQRNGIPFEVHGTEVDILFTFEDTANGVHKFDHDEFRERFDRAQKRLADHEPDRAVSLLEDSLKERLGIYERAM